MSKKIMFTYPNLKWTEWMERTAWSIHPYNIGLLKAMIEDKYETVFVDAHTDNLSKKQFARRIENEHPDILGISVLTDEYAESGRIAARIAKEVKPDIKTVLGGVYATSCPEQAIQEPSLDFVVDGEGEYVFRDLCEHLLNGKKLPTKGILFRKNGSIINTGKADFIDDLDALPFPSYKGIYFMKYATRIQRESIEMPRAIPYAHISTSRGCPFKCCFCEAGFISGKKARLRSLENILNEVEGLIKDYGIKGLIIDDDNWLVNKNRGEKLVREFIDRKYNLKWQPITVALYQLDKEIIPLLKESGMQVAQISFESGVKRVLKEIIHKPLNLEHGIKMVEELKKNEIDTTANFVIGFPGETWDEIRQTLRFSESIDVDYVKINIATPLPNTELYEMAKKGGNLVKDFRFDRHLWSDGWIKTNEFTPQDLKFLRAYEWDRINFATPEKRLKIADMMGVSLERLGEIRRSTLEKASL